MDLRGAWEEEEEEREAGMAGHRSKSIDKGAWQTTGCCSETNIPSPRVNSSSQLNKAILTIMSKYLQYGEEVQSRIQVW